MALQSMTFSKIENCGYLRHIHTHSRPCVSRSTRSGARTGVWLVYRPCCTDLFLTSESHTVDPRWGRVLIEPSCLGLCEVEVRVSVQLVTGQCLTATAKLDLQMTTLTISDCNLTNWGSSFLREDLNHGAVFWVCTPLEDIRRRCWQIKSCDGCLGKALVSIGDSVCLNTLRKGLF